MARKDYVTRTLTLPNGKRKYIYGKNATEANAKLEEAKLLLRAGIDLDNDTTVGEFAQMWYTIYKKPDLKPKSQESLLNAINNHILPYMGAVAVQDVTPMTIKNCLNHLSDKSHSLYRTVLQTLRNIFDTAVDNNLIAKSPVPVKAKAKGVSKEEKEPLTRQQEKTLMEALEGTRAHLLVWFLKSTGLRRGEALGLMWNCVHIPNIKQATIQVKRNLVFVKGKAILEDTPKTDCSNREVPIPPDLALALLAHKQKSKSVFVFSKKNGEMMTESSFRRLWEIIDARQKPSEDEIWEELQKDKDDPKKIDRHPWVKRILDFDVTPHQLRHTYATRCFEDGMDVKEVQRLLGHSDPTITMKIYIHYCETQRKESTYEKVRESRQLQAQ